MPVRRSGYYSDPNLAKAFDNLAGAFGQHSGADVYGFARARAAKEEADRAAWIFDYAQKNPNFDQKFFDRLGVANKNYAPSQSYYAVDEGNRVSLTNNRNDNIRALQQTQMQERGKRDTAMLAPVAAGATRFVPPECQKDYNVPEYQVGAVELKPGEVTRMPDGTI